MIVCPSIFINRFLHDVQWNLIIVLTRWAGGARGINESGTNEDTHCLPVIWRKDAFFTYLQHQHGHGDQTMFGWGLSWFSCFKLLVCNYKGTSSFMTSAHDALVFVQVCVCAITSGQLYLHRDWCPAQRNLPLRSLDSNPDCNCTICWVRTWRAKLAGICCPSHNLAAFGDHDFSIPLNRDCNIFLIFLWVVR